MPKKCEPCDFFHPTNDMTYCPDCGQELKFTMFVPPSFQTEEAEALPRAEAWNHELAGYEQLELPWGVRWTQILAGIGIYCVISRTVKNLFFAICFVDAPEVQLEQVVMVYLLCTLIFYVVGALAGGAVAGAWSVNWVPQGIGVGVGVFVAPVILYLLFGPILGVSILALCVMIFVTTALSVLGAWIGHKVVRPSRYVIS